jgi:hypothetical protein
VPQTFGVASIDILRQTGRLINPELHRNIRFDDIYAFRKTNRVCTNNLRYGATSEARRVSMFWISPSRGELIKTTTDPFVSRETIGYQEFDITGQIILHILDLSE